jgi:tRNA dimethylallyltransferase
LSKKLILIAGPTASGKSNLAINIAKKINGEIINADSMQIYREFSVLSSRPKNIETKKIKHHLYGILSVKKYFSTGEWLKLVKKKVKECDENKKTPIIVGGTGLYFNAITKGISKVPNISSKVRKQARKLHENIGQNKFYEKLVVIDPIVQKKISPNDSQRSIRAYEVKISTNKSLYEWSSNTKSEFLQYDLKKIFLDVPRICLLENIIKRTEMMFKNNCINEVEKFLKLKIDQSLSSNKLIGVKEIASHLSGEVNLEEAKELINIKTRQYAKAQNTWSRGHMKNWTKIYSKDLTLLSKKVLKVIS